MEVDKCLPTNLHRFDNIFKMFEIFRLDEFFHWPDTIIKVISRKILMLAHYKIYAANAKVVVLTK